MVYLRATDPVWYLLHLYLLILSYYYSLVLKLEINTTYLLYKLIFIMSFRYAVKIR